MSKQFRFDALFFTPKGCDLTLDLDAIKLPDSNFQPLLKQIRRDILDNEEFTFGCGDPEFAVKFRKWKDTAAYVAYARCKDKVATKLEALTLLMTKLDRKAEGDMIDKMKANENIQMIDPKGWEDARNHMTPLAATYFTSNESLNDPLIHQIMPVILMGFFGGFDIEEDQSA